MFLSLFRAGADRSPWGDFFFSPVGRAGDVGGVTADSALTLSAVYGCVRVRAESFALLPFRLYRQRVGGGRQRVTDHWLHRLFAQAPNRWQTPFEFREMLQAHLDLRGNAFCRIVEDGAGGIAELLPMHPDAVTVELVGDSEWRYRYVRRGGSADTLRRDQVWHLRGLSGNGIVGYNPIELARESVGEALQYQAYSARFFANNATPPAWVKYPGKMADKATRETVREALQSAQTGANRGKLMVLDQGMELHAMAINLRDLQFLEARQMKVPEICRLFRVPPHMIADLSKATFSNIEQQAIEFWQHAMQPTAQRWESSIASQLLGPDTDLVCDFDMRAQMRGDSAARAQYIHNLVLDGVITRNEGRDIEGYDPIEGLDEPLVPTNERELSDPDRNGEAGAGERLPDADATVDEQVDAAAPSRRLHSLLIGNADRMARRICGGNTPSAAVLAEALAIGDDTAGRVLQFAAASGWHTGSVPVVATHLLGIALKGTL